MDEVRRWLDSGAEVQEGLRLLNKYAPNIYLRQLVIINAHKYKGLLIKSLSAFANASVTVLPVRSFRNDWQFLSNKDCPNELKILAADKITAYRNYVAAHELLFDCATQEDCFVTSKKVIENYIENRNIYSELTYYKEHDKILGKHWIFNETKRLAQLRNLPIKELFSRKENLEESVWRIGNEIKKGNKPHLAESRETRLKIKERELIEVERMINNYATI